MVQAGTLEIDAQLKLDGLTRDVERMKQKLDEGGASADSVNSDLFRLKGTAAGVGLAMASMGVAGALSLITIAKNTPATAGAMARIGVETQQTAFKIGESLAPAFDSFADLLEVVNQKLDENPELLQAVGDALTGAANAAKGLVESEDFQDTIDLVKDVITILRALKEQYDVFRDSDIGEFLFPKDEGKTFTEKILDSNPITKPINKIKDAIGIGAGLASGDQGKVSEGLANILRPSPAFGITPERIETVRDIGGGISDFLSPVTGAITDTVQGVVNWFDNIFSANNLSKQTLTQADRRFTTL